MASIASSASAAGGAFLDGATGRVGTLDALERERAVAPGDVYRGWDVNFDEPTKAGRAPPHAGSFRHGGVDFGPSAGLGAPAGPVLDDGYGRRVRRRPGDVAKPDCGCGCTGCSKAAGSGDFAVRVSRGDSPPPVPSHGAGAEGVADVRVPFGAVIPAASMEFPGTTSDLLEQSYEGSTDPRIPIGDGHQMPAETLLHAGRHSGELSSAAAHAFESEREGRLAQGSRDAMAVHGVPGGPPVTGGPGQDLGGVGGVGGGPVAVAGTAAAARDTAAAAVAETRAAVDHARQALAKLESDSAARAAEGKDREHLRSPIMWMGSAVDHAQARLRAALAYELGVAEATGAWKDAAYRTAAGQYSDKADLADQIAAEARRQARWERDAAARRDRQDWNDAASLGGLETLRSVRGLRGAALDLRDATTQAGARLTQIRSDVSTGTSSDVKKAEKEARAAAKEARREAARLAEVARQSPEGVHARAADRQVKRAAAAQNAADAAQAKADRAQKAADAAKASGDKRKAAAAQAKADRAQRRAEAAHIRASGERRKAKEAREHADKSRGARLRRAEVKARQARERAKQKRKALEDRMKRAEAGAAAKAEARRLRKRAERKRRGRNVYSGIFPDCDPAGCLCPGPCKPHEFCVAAWMPGIASQK